MDFTKQSPTILSTCTGMRGIERGLERVFIRLGWHAPKIVAHVEIEAFAAWNLVKQMEQGVLAPAPVWSDLKTFDWEAFHGKVHFLTGGYPCQPFSLAGKQKGVNDPRHLWPYYKRGFQSLRPLGGFFENVRQHLNNGYREVKESLEDLGYRVEQGIFSAEEVGAPHKRDRLFILALDNTYCDQPGTIIGNLTEMFGLPQAQCQPEHCSIIPGRTGENVANASCIGQREQNNEVGTESRQDAWSDTGRIGEGLDNSIGTGLEGYSRHDSAEGWKGQIGPTTPSSFPLGQGIYQYDWEHSRLKPRLGLTVNGYNFTEDLLRMAGNGVVEQTAEKAFLTLLQKFK